MNLNKRLRLLSLLIVIILVSGCGGGGGGGGGSAKVSLSGIVSTEIFDEDSQTYQYTAVAGGSVQLRLGSLTGTIVGSATTDAAGKFTFIVTPDSYTAIYEDTTGTVSKTGRITLTSSDNFDLIVNTPPGIPSE